MLLLMAWGAVVVMVGAKIGPVVLERVEISDECVEGFARKGTMFGAWTMMRKYIAGYDGSLISRPANWSIRSAISSVSFGVSLEGAGASVFERIVFFSFFFSFFFSDLRSCAISSSSSESETSSELVLTLFQRGIPVNLRRTG